jgi:hypothetical protein
VEERRHLAAVEALHGDLDLGGAVGADATE